MSEQPKMLSVDTYAMPPHGWTCFHCGETFKTPGGAADHFGAGPDAMPGCLIRVQLGDERGLQMALRKAEDELARYRAEDSDKDREMHAMQADHVVALQREEEAGYAKGLRDGQEMAEREAAIWRAEYHTQYARAEALSLELRRLRDGQPDGHQRPRQPGLVSSEPVVGD